MADVKLSSLIAPSFYDLHNALMKSLYTEYWMKGGRGSTKSSWASIETVFGMLQDRDANGIVYRKVANGIRDSVYAQIMWAINALGVQKLYKARVSPFEITCIPTGQRIMFRGADDPDKSKSLKLINGYFKYLWFEELPEFNGMEEIRTIKASVFRGGPGDGFTFYSYNPPRSAQNWVNAESLLPVPQRIVHHSDYRSVPPEWLGPAFLAEAESLRLINERVYRHMYLGEVTGTGGQVFDNVILREITPEERGCFDTVLNGGDFGFANDPDAVIRMHYDKRTQRLYLLQEIYGTRMNVDVLANRVRALIGSEYVTYDSEDPRMINELRRRNVRVLPAKKGPGSIEHGMRWLQDRAQIIIDPKTCPNAAREFAGYEYKQDRFGNFLSEYPDKDNHLIDAARYGCESETRGKLGFAPTLSSFAPTDRVFRN